MKHSVNLNGGNRITRQGREKDPTERVAQGSSITPFQRFNDKNPVTVFIISFFQGNFGLFDLDQTLTLLLAIANHLS
jgi:hypothetical protein